MRRSGARKAVGGALSRLRAVRREFAQRPAFARWAAEDALYLPDLREELAAGIDPRPLSAAIHEAEEAATYAREALEYRAWDAADDDMERAIEALARVGAAMGAPALVRAPRLRRHTVFRFARGLVLVFVQGNPTSPYPAWRRLDAAISAVARARRNPMPARARLYLASPERLRPLVLKAVGVARREVRAEVARLLDEAQEAYEYAVAALDLGALAAAPTDLDRLDTALRAVRHIVQRESAVYLPEPWPLRLPARWAATRAMRREAYEATRTTVAELEARLRERGAL